MSAPQPPAPSKWALEACQELRTLCYYNWENHESAPTVEQAAEIITHHHAAAQAETIALLEECQQFIQDSARVTTIAANTCDATGATVMGNQIVFHGKAGGLLFARLRTHLAQLKEGAT